MKPDQTQALHVEASKIVDIHRFVSHSDLYTLLRDLSNAPNVNIRIKRIDRMNYGNFSTVVRASGALVMIREMNSGTAEVIPDLRHVQHFELDQDFSTYHAGRIYGIR